MENIIHVCVICPPSLSHPAPASTPSVPNPLQLTTQLLSLDFHPAPVIRPTPEAGLSLHQRPVLSN
jgi:hypothetical protein